MDFDAQETSAVRCVYVSFDPLPFSGDISLHIAKNGVLPSKHRLKPQALPRQCLGSELRNGLMADRKVLP